jgi:hypothetical protein
VSQSKQSNFASKLGDSMTNMGDVVGLLKKEQDRLTNQLHGVSEALKAFGAAYGKQNGIRRKISAAGLSRIAAAQRKRWANVKGKNGQTGALLRHQRGGLCRLRLERKSQQPNG